MRFGFSLPRRQAKVAVEDRAATPRASRPADPVGETPGATAAAADAAADPERPHSSPKRGLLRFRSSADEQQAAEELANELHGEFQRWAAGHRHYTPEWLAAVCSDAAYQAKLLDVAHARRRGVRKGGTGGPAATVEAVDAAPSTPTSPPPTADPDAPRLSGRTTASASKGVGSKLKLDPFGTFGRSARARSSKRQAVQPEAAAADDPDPDKAGGQLKKAPFSGLGLTAGLSHLGAFGGKAEADKPVFATQQAAIQALARFVDELLDYDPTLAVAQAVARAALDEGLRTSALKQNRTWAALAITGAVRTMAARVHLGRLRQEAALDLQAYHGELSRQRHLAAQLEAVKRGIASQLAVAMAADGVRRMKVPSAALRAQCWWRGVRVRRRMARYRRWLERRAKWLLEKERSMAAAEKSRSMMLENLAHLASVERRKWARCDFVHSGWHPEFKVTETFDPMDFIRKPPKGDDFGVRSHKVKLALQSEWEFTVATEDDNTWIGIPVRARVKPACGKSTLGPPTRNTLNRPTTAGGTLAQPTGSATAVKRAKLSSSEREDNYFDVQYNWVPASFLKQALLDARKKGELSMDDGVSIFDLPSEPPAADGDFRSTDAKGDVGSGKGGCA